MTVGAAEAHRQLAAMGRMLNTGDPYGTRTIAGAKAAYVRGDIDVGELERRIDLLLGNDRPQP